MADKYPKKPYIDSDVFIGWIKGEVVPKKDADGKVVMVDRGKIGEHVLTLAEQQVYPIFISAYTLAEVQKKKGKPKLDQDENQNILDYFEHDFVNTVTVDRSIGEEANRLCRKHEGKGLSPADAIHLACAKKAGCDVLLSWDETLNSIEEDGIKVQYPKIIEPQPMSGVATPATQLSLIDQESEKVGSVDEVRINEQKTKEIESVAADVQRSGDRDSKGEASAEVPRKVRQIERVGLAQKSDEIQETKAIVTAEPPKDEVLAQNVMQTGTDDTPKVSVEAQSVESEGIAPIKPKDKPPLSH